MQEGGGAAIAVGWEGGSSPARPEARHPRSDRAALRTARILLLVSTAATLALDQATKAMALHLLEPGERVPVAGALFGLRLVRNSGGAFGILPGAPVFFFAASLLIVGFVAVWGWRSGTHSVALGLVAGGGIGNLVDRLVRPPGGIMGSVVDFLQLPYWPTFNLADTAIVVGAGLLLLAQLRRRD
ncbi:MAG: signal peptidase II [Actinomycetota bacterium]